MPTQDRRIALAIGVLSLVVTAAGCGTAATPSASGSSVAQPEPVVLNRAPADLGCDAIGVPYRRVVFRIDPSADEDVTARTEAGHMLRTFWTAEFRGGTAAVPVVFDATGAIVVTDGQVLDISEREWPRLAGHLVCPGPDAVWILESDPT